MSGGKLCICGFKTLEEKKLNWQVLQYQCNYSAFNGYRLTPSNYSTLHCNVCKMTWRTKANYVNEII